MSFIDKINNFKINKKFLLLAIVLLFFSVTGGTYAYLFSTGSITNSITGDMGTVDLELDVTRVLPVDETVNSILIFQFDELASNLNKGCIDPDGDYSLCQLYKINLKSNNNSINVNVNGSLSFNNATMPNLSWVLLGNTYNSSTKYTNDMFGNRFNTASATYKSFVNDYLLKSGDEIDFYILIWVNEIDRVQYDRGSYSGVVRFEDSNGNGITARFGNDSKNEFAETIMAPNAISDSGLDFSKTSVETETNGIYVRSGTENNQYPIYYYRGNVNNNLIFADFCWKVVRTTETGGLKLLYNGVVVDDQCNNTGASSQVATKAFNSSYNSPTYVGYMYSKYTFSNQKMNTITDAYVYGNSVTYSNGIYTLDDSAVDMVTDTWANVYGSGLNNNHYTCFSTGTTCESVSYIYQTSSNYAYYVTLTGGKTIETALIEMFGNNTTSSTIKGNNTTVGTLDYWYYTNIEQKGYSSYIEDTIWCNERSISDLGGFNPNGGSMSSNLNFLSSSKETPSLSCSRKIDKFTVDDMVNGNGNLDYPVGLLTLDEIVFAGGSKNSTNNTYYLYSGSDYWINTPSYYNPVDGVIHFYINNSGKLDVFYVDSSMGVRPSISLNSGFVLIGNGDGSVSNPYVIK